MPGTAEPSALDGWRLRQEPYYRPRGREVAAFEAAAAQRLPVLLTGPTGCGKTRFIEHMAWRLGRPLVTVACHEDLTAGDLAGRWLLDAQGTRWQDGPLAMAARHGAICYLDELVEARSDAVVVMHPLADSRRVLPLDRRGELLRAHPDFLLVASYNPQVHTLRATLKASTRQRFTALAFGYPQVDDETHVVAREGGVGADLAARLVALGQRTRRLRDEGLEEGASTRLLVHAARLVAAGLAPREACLQAIAAPLADDAELAAVLADLVHASFA